MAEGMLDENMFAEALTAMLEAKLQQLLEELLELIETNWFEGEPTLNHGQHAIYTDYIDDTVDMWEMEAEENWPFVEAGDYVSNLYNCYDSGVMERAFSELIEKPVDRMYAIIETAVNIQYIIWMLGAMGA